MRATALVLPLLAGSLDLTGALDVASRESTCELHCYVGLVQFPFAPTLTPLVAIGVGTDRALGVGDVIVAYAVILLALIAWWWFVGGVMSRERRGRFVSRLPSPVWGVAVYVGAAVLTFVAKLPPLAIADAVGLWAAVAVELAIWALVVTRLRRR